MAKQTTEVRQYENAAEWASEGPYNEGAARCRAARSSPLRLVRTGAPAGHYPDPAMTDSSILLFTKAGGAVGEADMGDGRKVFNMMPGLLAVTPANTACDYVGHGPVEMLVLGLPKQRVDLLCEQATGRTPSDLGSCHLFFRDPLIEALCLRLWEETADDQFGGEMFTDHLLNTLVLTVLARCGRSPPQDCRANPLSGDRLGRVLAYLADNLGRSVTLADLAAVAHLSEFHFARLFKRATGLAPHQYVIAQRIERTKVLVREGTLSLVRIAAVVGFASQSHLNRHFKRLVGCTPAEFRK